MIKKILLSFSTLFLLFQVQGQIIFSEDFDGVGGPTAGGPGTYSFPSGWLLYNVDNRTPNASVSYVNEAWERREDFQNNVSDSVAFSTSFYTPTGAADDWMWTPPITVTSANTSLKWNAKSYDPAYPDGYEVRVMSASTANTGGTGVLGNQVSASTMIFSTASAPAAWTANQVSLSAYAGQTIRIAFRNVSDDKFILVIDDVVVEVFVNNDISVVNGSASHGEYTAAPANQQTTPQNFQLKASLYNAGLQASTNVRLGCDVLVDGIFVASVQSSATPTMAANSTVPCTITYAPTVEGIHSFKFYPILDQADQVTSNDTIYDQTPFEITPLNMRRDNGIVVGQLGIGAGTEGFIGQTFRFETAVNIASVSSYFTIGYTGRRLATVIYNTNSSGVPTTYLATTDTLLYQDDSARLYTLPMNGGTYTLPAGEYAFLQVEFDSTLALGQTTQIFTANSGYVNWSTNPFGGFTPIESFGQGFAKAFMLYPNFDVCFGLNGGSLDTTTQASCNMSNGSAELILEPGFSVLWDDSTTNAINTSLAAGFHTYTLSSTYCSFTDSVEITNPGAPSATVALITNANCSGENGSIELNVEDGTMPYTYLWSDNSTDSILTAPAGSYSVTIADANNCQTSVSGVVISEPIVLTSTGSGTNETCNGCNDGTAFMTPSGGTPPYTIMWSNGAIGSPVTNLSPGDYIGLATDANGCQTTFLITITAFTNGISELNNYNISVYPNPVVDYLTLEAPKGNVLSVSLTDATGRTIGELTQSKTTFTADMNGLAKGVYQLVIRTSGGTIVSAIAKQ